MPLILTVLNKEYTRGCHNGTVIIGEHPKFRIWGFGVQMAVLVFRVQVLHIFSLRFARAFVAEGRFAFRAYGFATSICF